MHLSYVYTKWHFDPTKDNYTSISTKGLSVVDYYISPIASIFFKFSVHNIHGIISNHISIESTIPDHRIHTVENKQTLSTLQKVSLKIESTASAKLRSFSHE